jgi:hypothetical protein
MFFSTLLNQLCYFSKSSNLLFLVADTTMHPLLCNAAGGRFGGRGGGGRGHDALVNRCKEIKSGTYKRYRGRVKEVTGALVRVELDSPIKIVTGESLLSQLLVSVACL